MRTNRDDDRDDDRFLGHESIVEGFGGSSGVVRTRDGGFCATAMSMNVSAPVSPDVYKVVDGKLYLFHTAEAKAGFEADEAGVIKGADEKYAAAAYGPPPSA